MIGGSASVQILTFDVVSSTLRQFADLRWLLIGLLPYYYWPLGTGTRNFWMAPQAASLLYDINLGVYAGLRSTLLYV